MAHLLQKQLSKTRTHCLLKLFSTNDSRKGIAERVPVESARFQREVLVENEDSEETGLLRLEN